MKLYLLLLLTYLYYSEAQTGMEKITFTKLYRKNDPSLDTIPSDSFSDQVNLNVEITIDNTVYNMALSTRYQESWLASVDCKSRFCRLSKNKIIAPKTPTEYINNYQVQGNPGTYSISVNTGDTLADFLLYAAIDVDYSMDKRLCKKTTNGILALNKGFFNISPQMVVSLMTGSNKFSGIYNGVPCQYVAGQRNLQTEVAAINLALTGGEWTSRIYLIRNTRGAWQTWCVGGCTAIYDLTYNGISGPAKDINSINAFIGADENGMIDCDSRMTLQPISFIINNRPYLIDAKNYILESQDKFESKCQSAFKVEESDDTGNDQWRLGVPFFDQFLTVISYDQMDTNDQKDTYNQASKVYFLEINKQLGKYSLKSNINANCV